MTFRHQTPRRRHTVPPHLPGAVAHRSDDVAPNAELICMRYAHSPMGSNARICRNECGTGPHIYSAPIILTQGTVGAAGFRGDSGA